MSTNTNTVYIAGKISGDPDYRRKFAEARRELERAGYIVLDPSVLPSTGFEYAAYIRMSAAMLDECAAVCFLSDWQESNGAKCEHRRAAARGIRIFYYDEWRQKLKHAEQEAAQGGLQYATP